MPSTPNIPNSSPLVDAVKKCRTGLVAVFLFSLLINLLMLTAPLYMLQVFDRVLVSMSESTLIFLSIIAIFSFLILWGLDIIRGRIMINLGTWLDRRVSAEVLKANVRGGLENNSSSIQPIRDLASIKNFLTGPSIFPIIDIPWTPIFLFVLFALHMSLGWLALSGALILSLLALINDFATRKKINRAGQMSATALDDAQTAVNNADAVEAMNMMPNIATNWNEKVQSVAIEQARASRIGGLIASSSKIFRQLLQIAILGTGAWLVIRNQLTPGGMIAASILMARALAPIDQAITSWRSAIRALSAFKRSQTLLDGSIRRPTTQPLPNPKGALDVENVSYFHQGSKEPVLKNISFHLEPGESLGLIGATASGKSTLARILIGNLKPHNGYARLDSVDIASGDLNCFEDSIGYLPQDIELFSASVRQNIARMGEGEAKDVYMAADLAGIHEDILKLPEGYETRIGYGGVSLSGGQRQRIALARAIYGQPKLVVLDEPNSNLDLNGENALIRVLDVLSEQKTTVITIAHRPAILRNVNKILVLKDGTIQMMGDNDEVFSEVIPKPQQKIFPD